MDWQSHKKHRAQVIADEGQWVGLADEGGVPLCDLPRLVSMDAPVRRGDASEGEVTMLVRTPSGHPHQVVDELIADGLGRVDAQGALVPNSEPSRWIVVERPGGREGRRAYRVTHADVEGGTAGPSTLTAHLVDLLDKLNDFPAWSYPTSITGTWHRLDQDYATMFVHERDMSELQMAAAADGFVLSGPADQVIHRLISESLEASYRLAGITDDPPVVVTPLGTPAGPPLLLRPSDDPLWETVASPALTAGVQVSADLWWPGDDPVPGHTLTLPTVVVTVAMTEVV